MPRKAPPKPIRPLTRHEREYEAMLRRVYLNPFIKGLETAIEQIQRDYLAAREAIRAIPTDPKLPAKVAKVAGAYVTDLEAWHRRRVQQTIMRWWGIDGRGLLRKETIRPMMLEFIEENVNLITRLDIATRQAMLEAVEESFMSKPGDRNAIAKDVRRVMGVSRYRTKLIARDQTNKGIGQMNMVRQNEVGIEKYEWSDSGDQRVRPGHRDNNGFTFSWSEPPPTGHPGHAINCRCAARPIMPAKPKSASANPPTWEREHNG